LLWSGVEQPLQPVLSLRKWLLHQALVIEVEQIKCEEDERGCGCRYGPHKTERGDAGLGDGAQFAVNVCLLDWEAL
jgi:hypothetical protein